MRQVSDLFAALSRLRAFARDDSGQSLVVMVLCLTVLLGMAAFAIDMGENYLQHHREQVVADAAALAAANCLANPGSPSGLGPSCASGTDTADATAVAIDYAAANHLSITAGDVQIDTSADTVHVSASASSPSIFAAALGFKGFASSAAATASYANGESAACSASQQAAGSCYAIYAANSACGSANGWTATSISIPIVGAIHSQGSLNISNGSYSFDGPVTYSSGNCAYTRQQSASIASGSDTPTAGDNQLASYWPENFAAVYPACSPTGTYQCSGPGGTPSYCTAAANSFTFTYANTPNGIYCAYGSGTPSDPATWTGAVAFTSGAGTSSSASKPYSVTLIAGNVYASGAAALYLKPYAQNLLIYAAGTDAQASPGDAVSFQNGDYHLSGMIFAPQGTEAFASVSLGATFLEGLNVSTTNLSGKLTGIGPVTSGAGGSSGGDQLTQ